MAPIPQSPPTTCTQRNKPVPITLSSHSTLALTTTGDGSHAHLLRHTQPRNHAPSSPATLIASPPQVHTNPTTAPRASLSWSLAHPVHTKPACFRPRASAWNEWKPSSSSSCKFTSPLPSHSLLFPFSRPPSLSRYSCFTLSLVFFTDVHAGIVPRSWSNRKQSSIPSVVAGYGNERHGAESRAEREREREGDRGRERETEGEGNERRLRGKGDYTSNILFSFVLSYTDVLVGAVL